MTSIKIIDDQNPVLEPVSQTLCEICQKQFSNYVCPRCNLRYCSLACYKDLEHAECTESFYKESVTAEIQSRDLDKDSKSKMLEMLQRLEEEDQAEDLLESDEEDEELMERFRHVDLDETDPEVIWNLLSDKERKGFEAMLHEAQMGNWGKLKLPTYLPWWQDGPAPDLPSSIPDFTQMTPPTSRSSPHLAWHLTHLLLVYSYLMRHSMGNLLEDREDSLELCRTLSGQVLFSTEPGSPYGGIQDVLVEGVEEIVRIEDKTQLKKGSVLRRFDLQLLLLEDLGLLLKVSVRAMSDFWQAMNQMAKSAKRNRKSVALAARKIYFYLAAAAYLDNDRIDMLSMAVQTEVMRVKMEKEEFQKAYEAAQTAIKQHKQDKIKIEEL